MYKNQKIISVDGNVNAGKTSLIKSFISQNSHLNIQYIPEHTDLLCSDIKENLHFIKQQEKYLKTELIKYSIVNSSSADLFLMDRSFISIFAHTIATTSILSKVRIFVLKRLSKLIESKRILIPNCFVFFDVSYELSIERFNKNHTVKGTSLDLVNLNYFNTLKRFYHKWVQLVHGYEILSPSAFSLEDFKFVLYERALIIDLLNKVSQENI